MKQGWRGFTLVEMLVTLALVALVGSLLWQALATAAQLEMRLARTRTLSNDDQLRRAWVELALAGVMAGPQGDPVRFSGRGERLTAYTSMPPWPGSLGPELMTLEIGTAADGQRLVARRPGTDAALELWRWPGRDGGFEYLDRDGGWHDAWPPPSTAARPVTGTTAPPGPPPLPAAVRLNGPPAGAVLVGIAAVQGPMLRQQDLLPDDAVKRP
jgi:prepilin-type N-terminal cleavage/methylation domain-containing protein